jgi:O-Antigen ligase
LVVLVVLGIAFGGRAWNKFSSADLGVSAAGTGHIGEVTSGGRVQFWEVALEAFGEKPLLGTGAGTYQFSWNQHRPLDMVVHNAHSLYLQPLAELGVVGGALVIGMVLFLLWVGVSAWRAASGRQRELYAVLTSVSLAFAVGSAFDWFWQIAGVGVVFFLATGALVAARCSQLWHAAGERPFRQRSGLTVAGLAIAWLSMLALIGPLLVDYELTASNNAIAGGDAFNAVEHANTARSIEPWAASPYRQLGLLAEAQGEAAAERGEQAAAQSEYVEAVHRFDQAISRENDNWALYFDRARAEYRSGDEEAASADLAEAKRLNPLEACLAEGFEGC